MFLLFFVSFGVCRSDWCSRKTRKIKYKENRHTIDSRKTAQSLDCSHQKQRQVVHERPKMLPNGSKASTTTRLLAHFSMRFVVISMHRIAIGVQTSDIACHSSFDFPAFSILVIGSCNLIDANRNKFALLAGNLLLCIMKTMLSVSGEEKCAARVRAKRGVEFKYLIAVTSV